MRIASALALVLAAFPLVLPAADDVSARAYGILQKNCFMCHGEGKVSGLDLRSAATALAGGDHGPALIPSEPDESRLLKLVLQDQEPAMPPGRRLADEDIETLRTWIEEGAAFPGAADAAPAKNGAKPATANVANAEEDRPITPEERNYWAFQQPRRVDPPKVSDPAWSVNPIDAFALAAMKSRGLQPAPRAGRRTLIRRAYLDLTGLPPSPAEIDAFVKDPSPDAWPRLVDRLLATPQYGERWARHWLDLVRYADSEGFEFDTNRPEAWRYRDYVVRAFNDDKPYDRFVKEQLAGDEYLSPDPEEVRQNMIATAFLRLGPNGGSGGDRGKQDSLDDMITTSSMTFMGMTVGCARCHNHKFDPIPQKDYYRIQSVFYSTRPTTYPLVGADEVARYKGELARVTNLQRPLRKAKTEIEAPYRKRMMDELIAKLPEYMQVAWRTPADTRTDGQKLNVQQIEKTLLDDTLSHKIDEPKMAALMTAAEKRKYQDLNDQIAGLELQKPPMYPTAMAMTDASREPQPSYFLHRGSADSKGSRMSPGVLSVAAKGEYSFSLPPPTASTTWRRRRYAEWVASPENPLTARVMVNRLWQHHFGEGIVRTPSNFGKMGEQPSHPELLDWMAQEFIARGWSMKTMHREMMNSQLYQMASLDHTANLKIDPENRYFWRMPRERMEAEVIRDGILAVSGSLDRTLGGPCIYPYISPDVFQASSRRTWPGKPDDDPSTFRRSLYVFSKRSIRYPMFEAYDQPNLVNTCDRRNRSTIAPQALILMNNNFVITQAKLFAHRLEKEAGADPGAQVEWAFQLALGRSPSKEEKTNSIAYVRGGAGRLAEFCQAIFNLNEFVYRP